MGGVEMGVLTGTIGFGAKLGRRKEEPACDPRAAFRWRKLEEPLLLPAPANLDAINLDDTPAPKESINHKAARAFPALTPKRARIEPAVAARLLAFGDWMFLAGAFSAAITMGAETPLGALTLTAAAAFAIPLLALKAGLWLLGAYQPAHAEHAERALGGLALGAIAGIALGAWIAPGAQAAAALAAIIPPAAVAMTALHAGVSLFVRRSTRAGAYAETAIVVGATEAARRFIARARETGRLHIVAAVDDRAERAPSHLEGVPVAGSVDDL
ncbi:MAG: nucleoside-diphosphate sugar epimerase/dehydratase, partial [Hyphomonadaceae bacterium]